MKNTSKKKKTIRSIQAEAIYAMVEAAKLFPNQDPIRLASGFIAFALPADKTINLLRALAPHFKGDNSDMIRLAAGYNDLNKSIKAMRVSAIAAKLI